MGGVLQAGRSGLLEFWLWAGLIWQDTCLEPGRYRRLIQRMFEQRPTFLARKNPGTGWEVDILWPDGETGVIKGFIAEYDAVKWIAEHEHSKARPGNATDKSPQTHSAPQPACEQSRAWT
jgi:hypothetical protein